MRYVIVLERPAGQPLAQMLARKVEPWSEGAIVQQFLRPLTEILSEFVKMGISHNRIHPGNIYISGKTFTLGECISEPSGYSQDILFEPIERMLAMPRAKADFAPVADCYALAVLALHLALGSSPFAKASKDTLMRHILSNGAYHVLVMPWDVPAELQDFLRGTLNDGRRDRWDVATLENWLAGRRFNLVMPPPLRETSHGFEFAGETHYTRRSLAHGLWRNWKDALALLADHRLARWLKTHVHKQETSDAVARVSHTGTQLSPQQEDEALARVIMVLDPAGPLRFRHLSFDIEGVGALLAHAAIAERREDTQAITQIFDADLLGFWIEQQKPSPELAALTAKLNKVRNNMRMKGLGFGAERSLYDLNPGLPCLSPMLKGRHVMTLADMLSALDAVSPQKAAAEGIDERHVAAFIASRLDMGREIDLPELRALPALKSNPTLIMLKLLVKAQRKAGGQSLRGLVHWLALKLLPLFADIHSRSRQRKLQAALRAVTAKGSLEALSDLFMGDAGFEADRREFQRAADDYAARKRNIALLKGTAGLTRHADLKGHGVAQSIAYGICITTVYFTLKAYFHL
jgi:hypothetical protein